MSLGPLMIDLAGTALTAEERELLRHPLVGGVILFTRNYADPAAARRARRRYPCRAHPAAHRRRRPGGRPRAALPHRLLGAARRRGASGTTSTSTRGRGLALARRIGWLMAAELRAHGVDISFAPCVDLDLGVSEVIGDRAFHAAPAAVAQLALAWMHGHARGRYGGHRQALSRPRRGRGRFAPHAAGRPAQPCRICTPDLAPYRRLIANGLPAVMVAHVLFPAVDPAPASLSGRWIRDVLRGELRFQGVVFTDDLSMGGAAAAYGDILGRARQALSAGCDMLPVCNDRAGVIELLAGARILSRSRRRSLRLVRLHGRSRGARACGSRGIARSGRARASCWPAAPRRRH